MQRAQAGRPARGRGRRREGQRDGREAGRSVGRTSAALDLTHTACKKSEVSSRASERGGERDAQTAHELSLVTAPGGICFDLPLRGREILRDLAMVEKCGRRGARRRELRRAPEECQSARKVDGERGRDAQRRTAEREKSEVGRRRKERSSAGDGLATRSGGTSARFGSADEAGAAYIALRLLLGSGGRRGDHDEAPADGQGLRTLDGSERARKSHVGARNVVTGAYRLGGGLEGRYRDLRRARESQRGARERRREGG